MAADCRRYTGFIQRNTIFSIRLNTRNAAGGRLPPLQNICTESPCFQRVYHRFASVKYQKRNALPPLQAWYLSACYIIQPKPRILFWGFIPRKERFCEKGREKAPALGGGRSKAAGDPVRAYGKQDSTSIGICRKDPFPGFSDKIFRADAQPNSPNPWLFDKMEKMSKMYNHFRNCE